MSPVVFTVEAIDTFCDFTNRVVPFLGQNDPSAEAVDANDPLNSTFGPSVDLVS